MKTNEQENRTGSFEIPERRETGIAGPSREVSQRDQMASCTATCAGREMNEPGWTRRHINDEPIPQLAERETGFFEPGIGASRESKSTDRKRALVMREIPLYLHPAALQRGVRLKGGKIYHVVIVRSHWYHYMIRIRCSTKKAAEHYDQSQNTEQTNTIVSSKCGDGP